MSSEQQSSSDLAAAARAAAWNAERQRQLARRQERIRAIADYARSRGLDANPDIVARHLAWFERWYSGYLATGYLKGRTGVKDIPGRRPQ